MNVAFIPVRGGSKSIPLKNIKKMLGKPLVYWTIRAAADCSSIDKIYVATDSDEIMSVLESIRCTEEGISSKLIAISRSAESASDTASTESAMLEFAEEYDFTNIVLIQATSPLLTSNDLDAGFLAYTQKEVDSVLSVVRQKRFVWEKDDKGFAKSVNYDVYNRPRRQEFSGYLVENGAFYITSRERLLNSKNRVSGNIKVVEMNEDTFFEIDEPEDWDIIEQLLSRSRLKKISEENRSIKMFLTDCDGCLTDGGMYYTEKGDELKKFNARDGMGFSLLKKRGIITGIITGENVELNRRRAEKLGLDIYECGIKNKSEKIIELSQRYNIELENILYVGDDINDLDALKLVGYSCCPCDAEEKIKDVVTYITEKSGGQGVIREIVDKFLEL